MNIETEKTHAIQSHIAGNLAAAEASYRLIINQGAKDQDIFNNLGVILLESFSYKEAAECFREALSINPDFPEAHSGLGSALISVDPVQAEQQFRTAIKLNPRFHQAKYNLANLLWKNGQLEMAISFYRQAIQDNPDFVYAHFNMSMALLLTGNLKEGFAEYEYRLARKDYISAINLPERRWLWNGDMQTSYQVVLVPEPGFGDVFQFIRYGKLLREKGVYVVFRAKESLQQLLDTSGCYDKFIPLRQAIDPSNQRWYPLFSLPYLFNTTLENIPADIPYLHADAKRIKKWKKYFPKGKTRIGINWQGNPHHEKTMNEGRSIPLQYFSVIASLTTISLVSLQKFHGLEQLDKCSFREKILVLDEHDYPSEPAFLEAAALIKTLDLVITSDTSIAHLAGALGVPVWVGLPYIPDWRWLIGDKETRWYPTMKLYRQTAPGDWESVFNQMRADLEAMAS